MAPWDKTKTGHKKTETDVMSASAKGPGDSHGFKPGPVI